MHGKGVRNPSWCIPYYPLKKGGLRCKPKQHELEINIELILYQTIIFVFIFIWYDLVLYFIFLICVWLFIVNTQHPGLRLPFTMHGVERLRQSVVGFSWSWFVDHPQWPWEILLCFFIVALGHMCTLLDRKG